MLKRESWRIIETILRRYPSTKAEYEEYIAVTMSNPPSEQEDIYQNSENKPQSVTEAKALKMCSRYADRLEREINAVERAYESLKPEEQKIVRLRYWGGGRKPVTYIRMTEYGYSERHLKRIVSKMIYLIGKNLGEIK